jgi:hypothetical protein
MARDLSSRMWEFWVSQWPIVRITRTSAKKNMATHAQSDIDAVWVPCEQLIQPCTPQKRRGMHFCLAILGHNKHGHTKDHVLHKGSHNSGNTTGGLFWALGWSWHGGISVDAWDLLLSTLIIAWFHASVTSSHIMASILFPISISICAAGVTLNCAENLESPNQWVPIQYKLWQFEL